MILHVFRGNIMGSISANIFDLGVSGKIAVLKKLVI